MSNQQLQSTIDAACAKLLETAAMMGVQLTYEISSVPLLEEIADALRKMAKGDAAALSGGSFLIGAFLGEVIRRQLHGVWGRDENGDELSVTNGEFSCYPIERVRKYMARAKSNSLVFFAQVSSAGHAE